jgi:hypothetical protein
MQPSRVRAHMDTKALFRLLYPVVVGLACLPAAAQDSQSRSQARHETHDAQHAPRPASEALANPLLGAPRDYEDGYLSSLGVSPVQRPGSEQGDEGGNEQSAPASSLNPILGAPLDYEDSYAAGGGTRGQSAAQQSASYSLTPIEQQISPELSARIGTSSAQMSSRNEGASSRTGSLHRDIHKFGSVADSANLTVATPISKPIGHQDQDAASTVYRSPW